MHCKILKFLVMKKYLAVTETVKNIYIALEYTGTYINRLYISYNASNSSI